MFKIWPLKFIKQKKFFFQLDKTDIEITDNLINFLFKEDQLNLVPGPEEASVQERLTKVLNAVVRNTCRSAQCSSSFFFSFYLSFISLSFSLLLFLLFFFLLSNEFDSDIGKASLLHYVDIPSL